MNIIRILVVVFERYRLQIKFFKFVSIFVHVNIYKCIYSMFIYSQIPDHLLKIINFTHDNSRSVFTTLIGRWRDVILKRVIGIRIIWIVKIYEYFLVGTNNTKRIFLSNEIILFSSSFTEKKMMLPVCLILMIASTTMAQVPFLGACPNLETMMNFDLDRVSTIELVVIVYSVAKGRYRETGLNFSCVFLCYWLTCEVMQPAFRKLSSMGQWYTSDVTSNA